MAEYLPPIHISEVFNVDDYTYQDGYIIYKEADHRYLRPIQKLQKKTTGISYNELNLTTNVSENINITKLMNSADAAIRDNIAIGESISVGGNMACGKNIVNSGDIYTNNIFAKSISIKDAIIENTILTKASIDDVPISSRSLAFISTLTSDVQLQLDTNSKKQGERGEQGIQGESIKGDRGEQGIQGESIKGDQGEQGIQGESIKGDTGLTGNDGTNGSNGVKGDTGLTGNDGTNGSNGVKGDTGLTGNDGTNGSNGVKGDTGLTGNDGTNGSNGLDGKDGLNSTLGAYFVNLGVGTFPIYGTMSDFSSFGLSLYIKGDRDSFIIMPFFALFVFSEINQGGKFLSMGNLSNDIEYYNISSLFRVKSCTLYKWNKEDQAYQLVNTVNNTNPEKTWN
jgi:hypothetical protein